MILVSVFLHQIPKAIDKKPASNHISIMDALDILAIVIIAPIFAVSMFVLGLLLFGSIWWIWDKIERSLFPISMFRASILALSIILVPVSLTHSVLRFTDSPVVAYDFGTYEVDTTIVIVSYEHPNLLVIEPNFPLVKIRPMMGGSTDVICGGV